MKLFRILFGGSSTAILVVVIMATVYAVSSISGGLIDSVGSAAGAINGAIEGAKAGREQGLSAEDTSASIDSKITEVGKLEVLTAGVSIKNMHSVGNNDSFGGEKYANLLIMKGNAIFTVDLTKATFDEPADGKLTITLPQPEMDLTFNEEETQILAERQNSFFDGSAEDGYIAYLNTLAKSQTEIKSVLANYDSLMEQARKSAETQLSYIVQQASLTDRELVIEFAEEGDESE
ncbi:MAG TPA: DUF4230 domain-containing protein [Ruminococcus sp.]|nr:DUF4230 domain-containing protein [Ruminococcus sp.]